MWSYDDIAIFTAVVEQGSFVAAARKLKIPTSTVSRRIGKLEADVGVRLLERTSRKLHLTKSGRVFFEDCLPHVSQLKENVESLSSTHNELRGLIKFTAPTFLGSEVLGHWLLDFVQENKEIELDIHLSNQFEDILDGGMDFAIRVGPLEDSRYIAQFLFSSTYAVCASPGYIAANGALQRPPELSNHEVLLVNHQPKVWEFRHIETQITTEVRVSGRVRSNQIQFAREAAKNGFGIAVLPTISVQPMIASGELVQLLEDYVLLPARDLYLVYPSNKYLAKKTRHLLNHLLFVAKKLQNENTR